MSAIQCILGRWEEVGEENFERFLEALGVNFLARKLEDKINKTTEEWTKNGDEITFKTITPFGEKTLIFTMGKSFDEKTLDGREVQSIATEVGNEVHHQQIGKPRNVLYVRKINGEFLECHMTAQEGNASKEDASQGNTVTAFRKYKRC